VPWLLLQAEQAGYGDTAAEDDVEKVMRGVYRVRDIAWNKEAECWYWCKTEDAE